MQQERQAIVGAMYPEFASIVDKLIQTVDKPRLEELRKDFHTRLRITLTQPESAELIEDLWDFFYDWCIFEKNLSEEATQFSDSLKQQWQQLKLGSLRGLYSILKVNDDGLKLKELFTGKSYSIQRKLEADFIGISKGDIIEGRLIQDNSGKEDSRVFVRKPSYHPVEVHDYIHLKVKQFKRAKDFDTYQSWLWVLVGMYLKHRIYQHMPIEKIYDDNSRI